MHFDPNLPVTILTDASRLHGLGYAMGHFVDGRFRVLACGSKSLMQTQQLSWNVRAFILLSINALSTTFNVVTDHKPLEVIFKKDLFDIGNPRLQRIREKLLEYNFTVTRVPGKGHLIANALSRAPLFAPEEVEDITIDTTRVFFCFCLLDKGRLIGPGARK